MIAILSPAKTMEINKDNKIEHYSEPIFKKEALKLVEELRKYSPYDLASLMKINDELSELNFFRYIDWELGHSLLNSRQAILAFKGAVYQGLRADEFNEEQLNYAQEHLRVLSGLYGVLRPLDLIEPYRLEMGIKLKNSKGKNLYHFWKEKITHNINDEINKQENKALINLASNEYFSAIDAEKIEGKIITPVFKEYRQGTYKNITIYAKRARGLMAKYIVENQIDEIEALKSFEEEGYEYNDGLSKENQLVFTR